MIDIRRVLGAATAAFLLCGASAWAQAPAAKAERPWAKGVPEAKQRQALELFGKGNGLLKDSLFVQAAATYREALTHWDHPAIHYNLVLALLNLDQPVEVLTHLDAAMKFGEAPLDADKFAQARSYRKLVERQLARVDVRCEVPGATVVMDGRPLFTAPGRHEAWVRSGPHTIVASAEGYLTREISKALPPGETTVVTLDLFRAEDLTVMKRRFPVWVPWVTVVAGAAVAGGAGWLHNSAREDFLSYDQSIVECGGCIPAAEVAGALQRGQTRQSLAIGGYALGGGALAAGVALLYLNKPEATQLRPDELQRPDVSVAPLLAPGAGGFVATVRF